uniref:Uncharacterized protein n=1 Tax=Triticum urartu TaxID=4572 RepID=A0A8R7V446_TRIUA
MTTEHSAARMTRPRSSLPPAPRPWRAPWTIQARKANSTTTKTMLSVTKMITTVQSFPWMSALLLRMAWNPL